MTRYIACTLISFPLLMTAASAGPATFIDGVFTSQAQCDELSQGGPEPESINRLTSDGFQDIEWSCDFVRIDRHEPLDGWVASLMCQEPGHVYPDMVAMQFIAENLLKVTFMSDEVAARQGNSSTPPLDFIPCTAAN